MIDAQRVLIVLPVRLGSTRLPKKALLDKTGVPLVVHAAQQAALSKYADQIVIAGDADEIKRAVTPFGFEYAETGAHHTSGSSRCAEVLDTHPADIVVNVQGDEPEVSPDHIDAVIEALAEPSRPCATLACPLEESDKDNPNVVKIARSEGGLGLYFSRAPIPFDRDAHGIASWRHVGLYAYRPSTLRQFCALPQSPLELAEQLEQLRLLEHGIPLYVATHDQPSPAGVDTLEQYDAFVSRWRKQQSPC